MFKVEQPSNKCLYALAKEHGYEADKIHFRTRGFKLETEHKNISEDIYMVGWMCVSIEFAKNIYPQFMVEFAEKVPAKCL